MKKAAYVNTGAGMSGCGTWRYWLARSWDSGQRTLVVIGLNPSTADESLDDPTIRRCVRFAKDWGFAQLSMLNLFAFRATNPAELLTAANPVGPFNDATIHSLAKDAAMVLAAWGSRGDFQHRHGDVLRLLGDRAVYCLGRCANGQPRHPLYVRADTQPVLYEATI